MKKKKKKKTSWGKKILKYIGLSSALVFGFIGVSLGVFALFGGFNEKIVSLTGMNFEQPAYVLVGTGNKEINGENKVIDTSIKIHPQNEDATKLNVSLSGGANIVSFEEINKVGKNLNIVLEQSSAIDPNEASAGLKSFNKGGEFTLSAVQNEDLIAANPAYVFVEAPIQSFSLSNNLTNINEIYPGTIFNLTTSNVFPANALNKPTNNIFTNTFGANYFNKTVLFYSSNESIAEVD
ncbi:MAG: hypothetical protein IKY10_02480, partial [Clostridia bacterium]|nr:hypothetical protein [Clostridia bacterium]